MEVFDKFAEDYDAGYKDTVSISGFDNNYFYEYKIREVCRILSNSNTKNPLTILDFGCGVGNVDPYIRKYFPDSKIYGLDVSTESIKVAKEKQSRFDISYAVFDKNEGNPFDISFDLIFVSCVFHHIPKENHMETLSFLKSCMKPDALLFVFEHNPYNPVTRAVFNKHDRPIDENANLICPRYLKKQMRQCHFKTASINFTVFFPKLLSVLMPLEKYMVSIPLGVQYYILAK